MLSEEFFLLRKKLVDFHFALAKVTLNSLEIVTANLTEEMSV